MTRIQQRIDSAANWEFENPLLLPGEVGWEKNTRRSKVGDGVTLWNGLPYTATEADITKESIGLGQVDNTPDLDKPVSSATQAALDLALSQVQNALESQINQKADSAVVDAALAAKAPLASPAFTGLPTVPDSSVANYNTTLIANTSTVQKMILRQLPLQQGIWQVPSLQSGWINYATSDAWQNARYINEKGTIRVEGLIKSGTTGVIFNLPLGYRPAGPLIFICDANAGFARVDVSDSGDVSLSSFKAGGNNTYLSLSNISFLPKPS